MDINKIDFRTLNSIDEIKSIDLISFFKAAGYDWQVDKEKIEKICYYTKSRANPGKKDFALSYGMEQPFFLKAVAEWAKCKSFFEIGTGRGTACYAVSLIDSIQKLCTVDIVPFTVKKNEAIGYEPAFVSNEDLYGMIPYNQKNKIEFYLRDNISVIKEQSGEGFDLLFIDGDHTNPTMIMQDFQICKSMSHDNSLIIWDDYDPQKFAVRGVIREVQRKFPEYSTMLIESRGHLFHNQKPESGAGMVLMKKGGFDESIFP